MKKISFLTLMLLLVIKGYGQMATYDAATNTELIKQSAIMTKQSIASTKNLAEAVLHTKYLTETLNFWKKTEELLQKVNSTLNTMEAVADLINKEIIMINYCSDYSRKVRNMKYLDTNEISGFITSLNDLLATSHNLLSLANNVLKSGVFKMNDSERIQNINNITQKLNENMALLSYNYYRAKNLNQYRALSLSLKN